VRSTPITFDKPLEVPRPYKSYRFDSYSLKAGRRLTLYGKAALSQFIELEADPLVTALCERSMHIPDSKPKRVVDFWGLKETVATFYLLLKPDELSESSKLRLPYREFQKWAGACGAQVVEVSTESFHERRCRLGNMLIISQHVAVHRGQVTPELLERCMNELPASFTLTQAEAAIAALDGMLVRASVFQLFLVGKLQCERLNEQPINLHTTWSSV
jgi:hypothetical protein